MTDEEQFGEYRVLDVLGHGAMGLVYRARDPRLDRLVALKIVHPGRGAKDPTKARARLVAEARALARVSHPNVLQVFDVGVQDELVYVALELVDGIDLAQWLRARPRTSAEVVDVFVEAAGGLAAVHEAGLVHRDVKPANILVEKAAKGLEHGRVLVADFGIARETAATLPVTLPGDATRSGEIEDASLTEEGRVVGTPAYMAPEQHLGRDVDAAADQYALCVALYEGLYRKRPFTGDAQLMAYQKTNPRNEPPSADVPAWLWTIVRRGLSPDPGDRFPSIEDLRAALKRGAPRRRWPRALGLAALAIAGTGTVVALAWDRPCRGVRAQVEELWNPKRRHAIEAAFAASDRPHATETWTRVADRFDAYASELSAVYREACVATRVDHEQSEALFDRRIACLDQRKHALAQSLALLAVGDADVVDHAEDIAASLGPVADCGDVEALESGIAPPSAEQREAVAAVRIAIADVDALFTVGRYDDAARTADAAVPLAREVDYAPVLVEALTHAAEAYERVNRVAEARDALDEAVEIGMPLGHDVYVGRAVTLRIWIVARYGGDLETARRLGALGRSLLERRGDPAPPAIALYNVLGAAYAAAGRHDDALREYERGLARAEGADPPLTAWAANLHSNIGHTWHLLGDLDSARASYERALATFRQEFGDDHPMVAGTELRLAQLLELSGRHHEAIAGFRRAIATFERIQASPDELGTALISLGQALRSIGADEEPDATYRRAIELLEPTGDGPSLAHALVNYGSVCFEQGIYDAAEAHFQRTIELLEPIDPTNPHLWSAWIGLGRIREVQSRPDEALSLYRRAHEAATSSKLNARVGARALVQIALLHRAAGRYDEAIAALDRQDEVLAATSVVVPDDRIYAAIARLRVMVDAGRAAEATDLVARLDAMIAEARHEGVLRRVGEGDLVLGRARVARGEVDAGCAAIARAIEAASNRPALLAEARAAHAVCENEPR